MRVAARRYLLCPRWARAQLCRISYTNSLRNRKRDSEVVTYPTRSNIKREELLVGELSRMTYAMSWEVLTPSSPPLQKVEEYQDLQDLLWGSNMCMVILHYVRLGYWPCTYDVCLNFGIFDPPPVSTKSMQPFSLWSEVG